MTLRTIPGNGADHGFTLLELLLVVTVIGLLTAVSLPRLHSATRQSELEQGANTLREFIVFGRNEAIYRGVRVRVIFEDDGTSFRMQTQDRALNYRTGYTDFDDSLLDTHSTLPGKVSIDKVITPEGVEEPRDIVFAPDATCTASTIELTGHDSRRATVTLGVLPSDVAIEYEREPS